MARSFFLPIITFSLLAGCSANPLALTAENPASPQAPEANVTPLPPLKRDAITQRTRKMLAQAAKQQEEWDQNGPASGERPGVKQQQPQQKQMDQMRGMQMPQEQTQPSPTPNN